MSTDRVATCLVQFQRTAVYSHATRIFVVAFMLISSAVLGPTRAELQNDQIGFSSNHVFDSAIEGESVDIMTGNLNLRIPIGQRYMLNDWFGYQVELYYNSKVWYHRCPVEDDDDEAPCPGDLAVPDHFGLGFNISFGRIYHHREDDPEIFRYQTPDGSERFFCEHLQGDVQDPVTPCSVLHQRTFDASRIAIEWQDADREWWIYPGDGTKIIMGEETSDAYSLADDPLRPWGGWFTTRIETIAQPNGEPQQSINIFYNTTEFDGKGVVQRIVRTRPAPSCRFLFDRRGFPRQGGKPCEEHRPSSCATPSRGSVKAARPRAAVTLPIFVSRSSPTLSPSDRRV